jgi:N-methylhydantoinase A
MTSSDFYRLATDIGGTFTDIVLERGSKRFTTKLLTTSRAPEEAVVEGTRLVLAEAGIDFSKIDTFVHGTTLATNAVIERKGAKTALIATEGFRDVIEIADEGRYDQYDIFIDKPRQLVPRQLRFTVAERIDVTGKVWIELDETHIRRIAAELIVQKVEAVAIAFLHSYSNGKHEARAAAILAQEAPGLAITQSSEVCPEMREYERTSTAIANAYVQPLMAGYLGRLKERFAAEGYKRPIHLMTSGGSLASLETAARFPIRLVESGPAGGAILAAHIAAEREENKVLSFDMGGTTAKICLIYNAEPYKARTFEVDRQSRFTKGSGLPVRIPVIEMVEIGAGGGSIARVDTLRRITVGPDSAGSQPGPACYGRGGTEPTVTDADVAIGKIDPKRFAGGVITIYPDKANEILADFIGSPLKMSTPMAAYGVSEIVDENMANAARVHAVERGVSVADHTMVAFGGAAPLHAARLAEKLGIRRIVVPADAGVGSAVGFLRAPAAYELVHSYFMRLQSFDLGAVNSLLSTMSAEANALASAAAGPRALSETRTAFMRYSGQGHEIAVNLPIRPLTTMDIAILLESFEEGYRKLFSRHIPGAAIEVLSWALLVTTETAHPEIIKIAHERSAPPAVSHRPVFDVRSNKAIDIPMYDRMTMQPGSNVSGPCIVVEDGTSTYVTASFDVHIDSGLALILTAKK